MYSEFTLFEGRAVMRMLRFVLSLLVFLSWIPTIYAQTAAQQALSREPEIIQLKASNRAHRESSNLPGDDIRKPGLATSAITQVHDMRANREALKRLEDRLQSQSVQCHFCAAKQEELSELMRQQVAADAMTNSILSSNGEDPEVGKFLGLSEEAPDYWKDLDTAGSMILSEASGHCQLAYAAAAAYNQRIACIRVANNNVAQMASAHEKAWSGCFKQHDWVKTGSQRAAYESCMAANDPTTKACLEDSRISRSGALCHRFLVVSSGDVSYLRNYRDRWESQIPSSTQRTAAVQSTSSQPSASAGQAASLKLMLIDVVAKPTYQTTVMEDVVTPANFRLGVPSRGNLQVRFDEPILGVVHGVGNHVVLVPVGTVVSLPYELAVTTIPKRGGMVGAGPIKIFKVGGWNKELRPVYKQILVSYPVPGAVVLRTGTPVQLFAQGNASLEISGDVYAKLQTVDEFKLVGMHSSAGAGKGKAKK
jgi:hypothetical protein